MALLVDKAVEIDFPVSKVWRALTDYREVERWSGVHLDGPFVSGSAARGRMTVPGYENTPWEVVVQRMVPERLFSYTWQDREGEPSTLVEFTLEKTKKGTLLRVVESGFEALRGRRAEEAARDHEGGWGAQLSSIAQYVKES
jgi:uncharacterized protein YndB with AHSA1/START domain